MLVNNLLSNAFKYARNKIIVSVKSDGLHTSLILRDLCDHVGEKMHYVSQVINQDMNGNFYDMVNRYRIQTAMELLMNDPDKTILDIALEVGFNSKTTFNACFKRIAAMTPSRFRALKKPPPVSDF